LQENGPHPSRDGHHPRTTLATRDEGRRETERCTATRCMGCRIACFASRISLNAWPSARGTRGPNKSPWRARAARRLFELAVAAEREETWRLVWERLEARGRL
jgi:hypothetical protein